VLLRHAPSGAVLRPGAAGAPGGPPVRFRSAAEAEAFSARFLDEPAAWQAVPAGQIEQEPKAA
jgi:hypothetical protein